MSEPLDDEAEVIDGLPVLPGELDAANTPASDATVAGPPRSRALALRMAAPVQAVAAALGGFVAGVAVVGLLSRRGRRRHPQLRRRGGRLARRARTRGKSPARRARGQVGARGQAAGELVQVVASRSLLVDVHMLGSASSNERR